MTTSDSAEARRQRRRAVSGLAIGFRSAARQRRFRPWHQTAGVAPAQALSLAGWDLSTLAQAMMDVVRIRTRKSFPRPRQG